MTVPAERNQVSRIRLADAEKMAASV